MAISYPLAFPTVGGLRRFTVRASEVAGLQTAPLSLEDTVHDWNADRLAADCELVPMYRAEAEVWVAFLWALRGVVGTFTMGDSLGATPRGTWAGVPLLAGAHAARARTLTVDGLTAGATGKAGDWLQFGSGSSTRLHKVLQDFAADGAGLATIEIYPSLRAALADNTPLVTSSAKGLWNLVSNTREYTIEAALYGGIRFACLEALRG